MALQGTVVITAKLLDHAAELLAQAGLTVVEAPPDKHGGIKLFKQHAADCVAVVSMLQDKFGPAEFDLAPNLKVVANYAVGFNNIDVAAARERGITVTNTPDVLTESTADTTWTLVMAAARRVLEADALTRRGDFHGWEPRMLLGLEFSGSTLGVIGAGRIGRAVLRRGKGFGMRLLYHNRKRMPAEYEQEIGCEYRTLDELLGESDVVTLNAPLNDESKDLLGEREFALMKPTAIFVNAGRGQSVDEAALVSALKNRTIFAAGLDVYRDEPALAPGLTELDNVVLFPHLGSATVKSRTDMCELVARNIIAVLEGRQPQTPVG